jgi:hypothetical protein
MQRDEPPPQTTDMGSQDAGWGAGMDRQVLFEIYNAIAAILLEVSPNECRNFFTHAGYRQK